MVDEKEKKRGKYMNNEIKLRQRFCKDCDIPVNVFDEPYFSDRLKLFDFLYDSVSKWDLFTKEFKKYDSSEDYLNDYSRIKDEAIETVRSAEGFQLFSAYGINDFSIKNKGLPSSRIYKPENNGRIYLSIDMKSANFSALHEYRDDIFGGAHTWEEFISRFTDNKHIINSKYIRQVIMGNLNPKRQTAYEKVLMDKLLTDILHTGVINKKYVAAFLADEIIFDVTDLENRHEVIADIYKISSQVPYMKTEVFSLHRIYGHGVDGYIKNVFSMSDASRSIKVKCVDRDMMAFVARYLLKESVTDFDKMFYYNGLLVKFEQVPEIVTDLKFDNKLR